MKSPSEVMKCPVCSKEKTERLFRLDERVAEGRFSVVRCKDCGITWTDPLPDKSEIAEFYPSAYHGKGGEERFFAVIERLVWFSRWKRAVEVARLTSGIPGRILDIGCGRGWMLSYLRGWGWEAYGTELSLDSSSFARDHLKLNILPKNVEDCSFPSQHFDAVTIWHTLEHLHQPISTLREANRILKDNGLLIVEVPNFGSLQAQLFGNKWFHLDSPRHLYHFDDKTLRKYLEKSGFRVIKSRNISWQYDIFGFVQSALNICCFNFDFLYNLLRSKEGGTATAKNSLKYTWDLFITALIVPLLMPVSIIVVLLSSLFEKGGTIRIYCRKK